VVLVADGSACDPSERTTGCAIGGSECVPSGGRDLCVAAGARDGRCRPTGMACDTGLACNGAPTTTTSRCRTAVAVDGLCDLLGIANACTPPGRCLGPMGSATCRAVSYRVESIVGATFVDACAMGRRLALLPGPGGAERRSSNRTTEPVAVPFEFSVFGERLSSLWPTTSGYATFAMPPDSPSTSVYISSVSPGYERLLAPFSGDLALRGSPTGDLCAATIGTAPSRRLVVEWLGAYRSSFSTENYTFELVLNEGTQVIEFVYQSIAISPMVPVGDRADLFNDTIGIRTGGATFARWMGGVLMPVAGIRFTPM
jgi:hypothetical protein